MGTPPDDELAAIAGFQPVQRVAQSYLGSLWLALDLRQGEPGKRVLLRRVQLPGQTPLEALQRMACAGRDAMALSHENVLSVVAVLQEGDTLAIAYEFVDAEPLRLLQSWATHRSVRFPVGVSLRISIDLLRGVRALHGTLHGWPSAPPFGGLSPDSVLVSRDGRTRLCDPLVASCATLLEGVGLNAAKLAYAAPEQVHATAPLAPPLDVFASAVLLWELLSGRRMLSGSRDTVERKLLEHDLPELGAHLPAEPAVSSELIALVTRSLSADPGKRPQTPAAFGAELERCGHEVATLAQVSEFVAELSGRQFERRSALRSLSLPTFSAVEQRDAPAAAEPTLTAEPRLAAEPAAPVLAPSTSAAPAPRASLPRFVVPLPPRAAGARRPAGTSGAWHAAAAATPRKPLPGWAEPSPFARTLQADPRARTRAEPDAATADAAAPTVRLPSAPAPGASSAAAAAAPEVVAIAPSMAPEVVAIASEPVAAAPSAAPPVPIFSERALAAAPLAPASASAPASAPGSEPVAVASAAPAQRTTLGMGRPSQPGLPPSHPALAPSLPFDDFPLPSALRGGTLNGVAVPPLPPLPVLAPVSPSVAPVPPSTPVPPTVPHSDPPDTVPGLGMFRPSREPGGATPLPEPRGVSLHTLSAPAGSGLLPRVAASARAQRPSGWSHAPSSGMRRAPRVRGVFKALLATAALSLAVVGALWLRPAPLAPLLARVQHAAATHGFGRLPSPRDEPARDVPAAAPARPEPLAVASVSAPSDAGAGSVPAPDVAAVRAGDELAAALTDQELAQLFALEPRAQLAGCAERLAANARRHSGSDLEKSQAMLKAARRELLRGKNDRGQQLLCSAVAHQPGSAAASQALAELLVHLGDAAQAKQVLERALQLKPTSRVLIGALGDACAVLGELERSRELWARSAPVSGDPAGRGPRLASMFAAAGERKLRSWSYGAALLYYRRAAVLSEGSSVASRGMSEALRQLGRLEAAQRWEARVSAPER